MLDQMLKKVKKPILAVMAWMSLSKKYRKYRKGVSIKKLSKEQKKEIKSYYKERFGIRVSTKYHELIYSLTGVYKKEFIPFPVYDDFVYGLSPFEYGKNLDDKAMYDWFLAGSKIPERVISCCNGVVYGYQDGKPTPISQNDLLNTVWDLPDCIIKPSKDSSAGIGVRAISVINGIVTETGEAIEKVIDSYHGFYVIEKRIKNSNCLKALNPSSCNTIRVHTWRNRETTSIEFVSAILRVGRAGAITDNISSGGVAVPVNRDGILSNSGCVKSNYRRFEKSSTGITFKGYKIDQFESIIDTVIKAHQNLPHFDFIGWDVTVDENDCVVIIEYNPNPGITFDDLYFLDTPLLEYHEKILHAAYKNKHNKY